MKAYYAHTEVAIPADTPLSGFGDHREKGNAFGPERCRVRTLWLKWNNTAPPLVFILADFLYFPTFLYQRLQQKLVQDYVISPEGLIAAGTHTHGGPEFGFFTTKDPQITLQKKFYDRIVTLFPEERDYRAATIESLDGRFTKALSIIRRRRLRIGPWRTARFYAAKYQPTNEELTGLCITRSGAKPVVLVQYASHPVFSRVNRISADYPGRVEDMIEDSHHLLLYQGFGGDLRPGYGYSTDDPSPKQRLTWRRIRQRIKLYGFPPYQPGQFAHFTRTLAGWVTRLSPAPLEGSEVKLSSFTTALRSHSGRTGKQLRTQLVLLDERVLLLVVAAEVFAAYRRLLCRHFPHLLIISIGCAAGCIGYLPTPEALEWGGYEVAEAPLWNGMDGPFEVSSIQHYEQKLLRSIQELIDSSSAATTE